MAMLFGFVDVVAFCDDCWIFVAVGYCLFCLCDLIFALVCLLILVVLTCVSWCCNSVVNQFLFFVVLRLLCYKDVFGCG